MMLEDRGCCRHSAVRATAATAPQRSLDFLNPGVPEASAPEASRNQGARTTASMAPRPVVADLYETRQAAKREREEEEARTAAVFAYCAAMDAETEKKERELEQYRRDLNLS